MNTAIAPISAVFWPPEQTIKTTFRVLLRYKNREAPVSRSANYVCRWYEKGCIDFPEISNFNISYNNATGYFDVSYTYVGDDEYINERLADHDTDGMFPIFIDGIPYRVIGTVIE